VIPARESALAAVLGARSVAPVLQGANLTRINDKSREVDVFEYRRSHHIAAYVFANVGIKGALGSGDMTGTSNSPH
jgi:hypothetical protein